MMVGAFAFAKGYAAIPNARRGSLNDETRSIVRAPAARTAARQVDEENYTGFVVYAQF